MIRNKLIKGLSVWTLFIVFHFGYKLFPSDLFTLLGCPFESVFQHMKMVFFAYVIVSVVEYLIIRKSARMGNSFWMSRLFSAVLISFFVYIVWYLYPVLFGLIESPGWEILYSNIIMMVCIAITLVLEDNFQNVKFPVVARIAIIFLFVTASVNYTILAFRTSPVGLFEKVEHNHGIEDNPADEHLIEGHDEDLQNGEHDH